MIIERNTRGTLVLAARCFGLKKAFFSCNYKTEDFCPEDQSIWSKHWQGSNPVVKLVLENYVFSCLSQLRSPHFI